MREQDKKAVEEHSDFTRNETLASSFLSIIEGDVMFKPIKSEKELIKRIILKDRFANQYTFDGGITFKSLKTLLDVRDSFNLSKPIMYTASEEPVNIGVCPITVKCIAQVDKKKFKAKNYKSKSLNTMILYSRHHDMVVVYELKYEVAKGLDDGDMRGLIHIKDWSTFQDIDKYVNYSRKIVYYRYIKRTCLDVLNGTLSSK